MKITFDTIPNAIEMLLQEVKEMRAEILGSSKGSQSEMVDRVAAREILGTRGRLLSEARFAQLKKEGKVNTYGFGGKHFYSVDELQKLKRR